MVPHIGKYLVPVKTKGASSQLAMLAPASIDDMPEDWNFPWVDIWKASNREGLIVIKMVFEDKIWGLVEYGIFPPKKNELVLITHIETNPLSRGKIPNRLVKPVGQWLIWYCVKVGLHYCSGIEKRLLLFAKAGIFDYYYRIIGMHHDKTVDLSPGEKVHAFEFSEASALKYSQSLESECGMPIQIDS